jgi:6-phosphogluconate dehydrogenase
MVHLNVGVVGLGRMGLSVVFRLVRAGFKVVGFDVGQQAREQAMALGALCVEDLEQIAPNLDALWIMVPAGDPVDDVIKQVLPTLPKNCVIIDGGNSNFHDSVRRANELASQEFSFLDCGTSGGLHGREIGFSLMIGGDETAYKKMVPLFQALAAPNGFGLMGPSGAGHYVKMVHNGIEYSLLQAYAEGFDLLKNGQYKNLDLEQISAVWSHGSIVRSWILELAREVFKHDQSFTDVSGQIGENKTGQWTLDEAKHAGVTLDLLEKSLAIRAWSRQTGGNYATKLVALLRHQFGGHPVKKSE